MVRAGGPCLVSQPDHTDFAKTPGILRAFLASRNGTVAYVWTMRLEYESTFEDHLTFQLFTASRSRRILWQRRITGAVFVLLAALLAFLNYHSGNMDAMWIWSVAGAIWAATYPFFSRWYYRRHYVKHLQEHFSASFGQKVVTSLEEDHLFLNSEGGDSRIKLREVRAIYRIPGLAIVALRSGHGVPLPQNQLGGQLDEFLKELSAKTGVAVQEYLKWKWR